MNYYSENMKSEEASNILRKFVEAAAKEPKRNEAPPQERFYEDFFLLTQRPRDGWAVGLRVDFTSHAWSIAEVQALPTGSTHSLPQVNDEETASYVAAAVERARGRRLALAHQLEKLHQNAEFIQERFETWRDKNARRTNVEYAALAAKYAEQVRLGNSRATATLANEAGMSPSVMAQRIKETRRRGLLTRGEQGRVAGALTELGVLYADPEFPGMQSERRNGMLLREISDKYGIPESLVWMGMHGELHENSVRFSFEDPSPSGEGED